MTSPNYREVVEVTNNLIVKKFYVEFTAKGVRLTLPKGESFLMSNATWRGFIEGFASTLDSDLPIGPL